MTNVNEVKELNAVAVAGTREDEAVKAIANSTKPAELVRALADYLRNKTGANWALVEEFKTCRDTAFRFREVLADSPIELLSGKFFKYGYLSTRDEIAPDFTQADFQAVIAAGFTMLGCSKEKIKVATQMGVIQDAAALLVRIETDKTAVFSFGFAITQAVAPIPDEDEIFASVIKTSIPDAGDRSRNEPVYLMSARASRFMFESKPYDSNTLAIIKKVAVATGWHDVQMHGQQLLFIANV